MQSTQTGSPPVSKLEGFTFQKPAVDTTPVTEEELEEAASGFDPLEAAKDEVKAEAKSTPALRYRERLKSESIELADAMAAIDSLAVEGSYSETQPLSRTVKVNLKTRSTRFNSYLADRIDIADPKKVGKLNQLMSEYQVAASLTRYGELTLPVLDDAAPAKEWEAALDGRLAFVRRLPAPIFVALCSKLSRFDTKMLVIISEGYEQNF